MRRAIHRSEPVAGTAGWRSSITHRQAVVGVGAALVGATAGCVSLPGQGIPDRSYDRLQRTAVYLEDSVELSLPDEVETVSARSNADLLVLPGDTEVDAEQAVGWLADERVLALVGDASESTWLTWARSDVYADAFENEGYADGDPGPQLLMAATIGPQVRTYRRTWADGPPNRDLLRGLDETLVDIEAETSR